MTTPKHKCNQTGPGNQNAHGDNNATAGLSGGTFRQQSLISHPIVLNIRTDASYPSEPRAWAD